MRAKGVSNTDNSPDAGFVDHAVNAPELLD